MTKNFLIPFEADNYSDEIILEYAGRLVDGILVVSDLIFDTVEFERTSIEWNMKATSSPNTYSLFLHSLNSVYYLSYAFEITNDTEYFDLAYSIVYSYIDYLCSNETKNAYTWYDQSAALRTENLIYFHSIYKKKIGTADECLVDIIRKHADWLMNDRNYCHRHNHGIYQDAALIKAGYIFNNVDYCNNAIKRLDSQLKYAFPNGFAHIENSIIYNLYVLNYTLSLSNFLFNISIILALIVLLL